MAIITPRSRCEIRGHPHFRERPGQLLPKEPKQGVGVKGSASGGDRPELRA